MQTTETLIWAMKRLEVGGVLQITPSTSYEAL
jgi:hypothetical protein